MTATPVPPPTQANATMGGSTSHGRSHPLSRLQWAVRTVLALGVAASIAANVLHARPNLISQVIAAWPPLALLLTVELISRVPADRRVLAVVRLLATAIIAGIAAWVSYWHMVGVAAHYGETEAAASYLLPLSVDGLVMVASISLVEIAGRIRSLNPPAVTMQPRPAPPRNLEHRATGSSTAPSRDPRRDRRSVTAPPLGTHHRGRTAAMTRPAHGRGNNTARPSRASVALQVTGSPATEEIRPRQPHAPVSTDSEPPAEAALSYDPPAPPRHDRSTSTGAPDAQVGRRRQDNGAEVAVDTATAVAHWYGQDPTLHPSEIAARIGRSERTVRRYWPPAVHSAGEEGDAPDRALTRGPTG